MKKIVRSAIFAVVGTTGVYLVARALGADEPAAYVAATVAVAVAAYAVAAYVAATVAEQEGVRYRWALSAYLLEALAIGGALAVGNVVWCVAIALAGVASLFIVLRLAPQPSASVQVAQ